MSQWKLGCLFAVMALFVSAAELPAQMTWSGGGDQATFSGAWITPPAHVLEAAGLPNTAVSFDMFVTTTADILLVDAALTVTGGSLYNTPPSELGSDTSPPNPAILLAPGFEQLVADSWVTTPNPGTAAAGIKTLDDVGTMVTHFDSTDDGPQTDFHFARITLVPDDPSLFNFVFEGTIQTAADPTPVFDDFSYRSLLESPEGFADILSDPATGTTDFFSRSGSDPSIAAADASANGATMFVPSDSALANFTGVLDVNDLIVVDDGTPTMPTDSGTFGWDISDLTNVVPQTGDIASLFPMSGNEFLLENGSLMYGGANIISSHRADNGWVHVLDAVPVAVPEPGSLAIAMMGVLFGWTAVRRRR